MVILLRFTNFFLDSRMKIETTLNNLRNSSEPAGMQPKMSYQWESGYLKMRSFFLNTEMHHPTMMSRTYIAMKIRSIV